MESLNHAASNLSISDEDDRRIFQSLSSILVNKILRIKHNDHEVTYLDLQIGGNIENQVWRRLGQILGQSTKVEKFDLHNWNQTGMNCFVPFLINNPSLKEIRLICCGIESSASLDILTNALTNRSEDTIELLSLNGNHFGDINLDALVSALTKCKKLRHLSLSSTGIGQKGCASIVTLLKNPTELEVLHLLYNSIDNECAVLLADVLSENYQLEELGLDLITEDGITAFGWSVLVKLICNTSSMEHVLNSNHTLSHLGVSRYMPYHCRVLLTALGVDSFNLLFASLELNANPNNNLVARHKIIWGHVMGDLEIGSSSILNGAMPEILAWFGDDESVAIGITPLNQSIASRSTDAAKLDSFYRIMKSRPSLCG